MVLDTWTLVDTGGMSCVVTSEWDMLEVFNMVMKVWNKLFSDDKICTTRGTAKYVSL